MTIPIYVTRPFLPPLEELLPSLEKIWERRILTNGGPFHAELETALADYLGVKCLSLFNNATIALITALQSLELQGEVITTPFSFVATAHSILWRGLKPVFVDIDEHTLNITPKAVEAAITPNTTAILPVHVYGTPCDVEGMADVARRHNLKILYDAAHAFNVKIRGTSVLGHGDLSVISFHATKIYNTFEGGAIITSDPEMKKKIDFLKNFGFAGEDTVLTSGINGKMNEFQAAVGLLQLKYIASIIEKRRVIDNWYRVHLHDVPGIRFVLQLPEVEHNYSYFPILVDERFPGGRDGLYDTLRKHDIYARRYFYPLISDIPMYRSNPSSIPSKLPTAHRVAAQVLCLPIYPELDIDTLERILAVITDASRVVVTGPKK